MDSINNINVECPRELLERRDIPDVNHRLNGRDLPLNSLTHSHINIYDSNENLFNYCISQGAEMDICFEYQRNPLHLAVYKSNGNINIIRNLIQAGADLNLRECLCNWTPLHIACCYGKYEAAKILLDNGAQTDPITDFQVNLPCPNGITPLYIAIDKNHNDIVSLLCKHKTNLANRSFKVGTPLFFAVMKGHHDIISTLLSFGADINALSTIYRRSNTQSETGAHISDKYILTPLHEAILHQNISTVRLLLSNPKIEVNLFVEKFQTPLHFALELKDTDIVSYILNSGGDINLLTAEKKTLIEHCLEENKHDDGIKLKIVEVVRNHFMKLQCIKWKLNKKNEENVADKKYRPYRKQCIKEVNTMNEDRIGVGYITVYDLLDRSKNISESLRGFQGERILCKEFKSRYPLYCELIQYRLLRYLQAQGNLIDYVI